MPPAPSSARPRSQSSASRASSASPPPRKRPKREPSSPKGPRKRENKGHTTVYDAVAGLVTPVGHLSSSSHHIPSFWRDIPAHGAASVLSPEEALYARTTAPDVFEEDNVYRAHRHLVGSEAEAARVREDIERMASRADAHGLMESVEEVERRKARVRVGILPESEMCKAVHGFASKFYAVHGGEWDWRSLEETALLGCAVLLEESVRGAMGETGWKAFVEGEEMIGKEVKVVNSGGKGKGKGKANVSIEQDMIAGEAELDIDETIGIERQKRRRKMVADRDNWGEDF